MSDDFKALADGTLLHKPKNTLLRIDAIYAFVSVDDDGTEGVCAMTTPGLGLTPLIAADETRLKQLIPLAESLARTSGMKIRLIKLTTREEIRDIG